MFRFKNESISKKIDFAIIVTLLLSTILIYLPEIGVTSIVKTIAIVLFIGCFFLGSDFTDLLGFALLIPCHEIFSINAISCVWILLLISVIKFLLYAKYQSANYLPIFLILPVFMIEFVFDFPNITIGVFIRIIFTLLYCFMFMQFFDFKNFDIKKLIYILIFSQFVPLIFTYIVGGRPIYEYFTSEEIIRFGEDSRNFSGAMFVPIYSMFVIILSTVLLIKYKMVIYIKMILYILMAVSFVFGMITVSRAFILGFFIYVCFLFLMLFQSKNKKMAYIILGITLGIFVSVYFIFFDSINTLIENYLFRTEVSGSSGRNEIYIQTITYLFAHPVNLFFGLGANHYKDVGLILDLKFYEGTHNIILDGFMSWGIVGFAGYIAVYYLFIKRVLNKSETKLSVLSTMLFIIYFIMIITSGVFYLFNTHIYLLVTVIIACMLTKKEELN